MLNAYSLLYAVLLITSGRLGDIYGPRNVFAVGVAIFTAASAVSAGSSLQLPPGIPQQVVLSLQNAAHYVFTHAFVDAMRPTLILPISLLIVAALATFLVRAQKPATADSEQVEEAAAVA